MKNKNIQAIFEEIQKDVHQKGAYLSTSHSFKSEDKDGKFIKTKGPGRLSFQQFIKNNYLENGTTAKKSNFTFLPAGKRNFKEIVDSFQEIPMVNAMEYIKNELAKYSSFKAKSEFIYRRFIVKKKNGLMISLVFSVLFSEYDGGMIVLYFDETTRKDADCDWGFPYEDIMFCDKSN